MTNYFVIFGLVFVIAGFFVTRYVHRSFERHSFSIGWRIARVCVPLIGIALGFYCFFFLIYQVSPTSRIHGFLFPVGVYKLRHGQWGGIGGGVTSLLGIVGDALFGYFLPHMIFAPLVWVHSRRHHAATKGSERIEAQSGRGLV